MRRLPLWISIPRKTSIIFILLATILLCSGGVSYAASFAATTPWLGEIASFIGSDKVRVRNLSVWSENGNAAAVGRPRAGDIIIAVNDADAARFRFSRKTRNLRLLYDSAPMTDLQLKSIFYDPALLPYVAQNVMKIISASDNARYSFYQRRLAEFQSRVEGAVDVGKHLLSNTKMLDLTGVTGVWVRAAVSGAVRPPKAVWQGWLDGDAAALKAALDEARRRKWLIVMDIWTPPSIRSVASAYENRVTIVPPSRNADYFTYLQDIYRMIWKRTQPVKKKSK